MDDLVRWLGEQLDTDAEAAREAVEQVGDGHWQQRNARIVTVADRDREVADFAVHECIDHIVRHDPARVLREIAAKRDLLVFAKGVHDHHETFTTGVYARQPRNAVAPRR